MIAAFLLSLSSLFLQPALTTSSVGQVAQTDVSAVQSVTIDLSEQRMYLFDDAGVELARWRVSTGAASSPTPRGVFRVQSKSRRTHVINNPAVTMEWMIRFKGHYGMHAIPRRNGTPMWTPLGRAPVSHGCVRLSDEHAEALYRSLPVGSRVVIRP